MRKRRSGCRACAGLRFTPGEVKRMLLSAVVFLIIAFVIRIMAGGPYRTISYCNLGSIFPSMFLLSVAWIIWYILLGAVFGSIFGSRVCRDEVSKYKGGMLFVLMMTLNYLWYPVFFGATAIFMALLLSEAVLVLAFFTAILFMRVRRGAGWVMLGFTGWMVYMTVLSAMSLFAV